MSPRKISTLLLNCGAVIGLVLLFGFGALALREWEAQPLGHAPSPAMTAALLREPADVIADEIAATYDGVFHATVYYTPIEEAFTAAAGYNMTPVTRPGLQGKKFSRDFLKAVELEGFGRMVTAVDGKPYVSCCRGTWAFAASPLDSCGKPLKALRSTAVGAEHEWVGTQTQFRVRAAGVPSQFLAARWEVCDTGGGLKPGQIDFYWGEDAPLGPGAKLSRPRGMPNAILNPTVLVLR